VTLLHDSCVHFALISMLSDSKLLADIVDSVVLHAQFVTKVCHSSVRPGVQQHMILLDMAQRHSTGRSS
jgi:hypothetical protein